MKNFIVIFNSINSFIHSIPFDKKKYFSKFNIWVRPNIGRVKRRLGNNAESPLLAASSVNRATNTKFTPQGGIIMRRPPPPPSSNGQFYNQYQFSTSG